MPILYAPHFLKSWGKLKPDLQKKAKRQIELFILNPKDPSLKNHKLHGTQKEAWAFSITQNYRLVYTYYEGDVVFLRIGPHSDVY